MVRPDEWDWNSCLDWGHFHGAFIYVGIPVPWMVWDLYMVYLDLPKTRENVSSIESEVGVSYFDMMPSYKCLI